jgi:hypothetical protein
MSAADLDHVRRVIDTERARIVRLIAAVDAITSAPAAAPAQRPVPARASGLYTRAEAAEALGVSLSSLDRMRRRGALSVVTLGAGHGARVMVTHTELCRVAASGHRVRPPRDTRHPTGVVVKGRLW